MTFKFPPDVQARLDANRTYQRERAVAARTLSDANLVLSARYCLSQMPSARAWSGADCVYDGQFFHVLLPELMKRLKAGPDSDALARRQHTEAANDE